MSVIALIFLALLAKTAWGLYSDSQRLKNLQKNTKNVLPDFEGLTAQQIQSNLSRIKTQNTNLDNLVSNSYVTPILSDIIRAIPAKVWLTKVNYKEEFPAKKGSRSLTLEGSIKTGNSEQDLALGKTFYDKLIQTSTIKSLCGNKGEIKYRDLALLGEGNGAGASNNANRSNKETSFVFTCEKGGSSK